MRGGPAPALPDSVSPLASTALAQSEFPRIGEYGFLSDCHTGALVAPDSSIEWLCLPRFDAPSVFGAILDRDAGTFRFAPNVQVPLARRYEPGTNIVETTWAAPQVFTHLALINAVSHVIADDLVDGEREGFSAVFSEIRARH